MRDYDSIVAEATLAATAPADVARYLEERATAVKPGRYSENGDVAFEQSLVERHDPLIDLSLARWCMHPETARALFVTCQGDDVQSLAVRLSLLSNTTAGASIMSGGPTLFFREPGTLDAWLSRASDDELRAFFTNPLLNDGFLRDFFDGKQSWAAMDDERRIKAVQSLARNTRMSARYDQRFLDGFAEYSHNAVFDAAWKLADTVPTTRAWAVTLQWFFDALLPQAFSIEAPLALTPRWFPDPSAADVLEREAMDVLRGYLGGYHGVRKGLARLALSQKPSLLPDLLLSEDPSLRAAAYSSGALTVAQLDAVPAADAALAFNEAVHNANVWRRQETREAVQAMAWAVTNADPQFDMTPVNVFNDVRARRAKEHPEWFRDEDLDRDASSDDAAMGAPATKADVQRVVDALASHGGDATALQQVAQAIAALNKRVGWIWWFSLGALMASLAYRL